MIIPASKICTLCGRRPRVAYHRPHSLHRTKRIVSVNLQKYRGALICSACRRTLTRNTP